MVFIWFYITYVIDQCDQNIITPLSLLMVSCWLGNTLEKKNRRAGGYGRKLLDLPLATYQAFSPCITILN